MTQRQTYAAWMSIACATFIIGGVVLPLSDLARYAGHLHAFWWLEAGGSASMVVAIVVLCFGLKTGGHFQRDERSTASAQKQMKYALLLFAVATSGPLIVRVFGNNMLPPSKLVLDMVQHSLPLWMAAAVWWLIWKPNDRTLT